MYGASEAIGFVILVILLCVAAFFGFGWLIQWLWNDLIPDLTGGPSISYWQALKLGFASLLVVCLFGAASARGKK